MCYKRKDLRNYYCCPFETSIQIPREREGKGTSERFNVTAVSHKQIRKCLSKGRLMRLPCHTLPSFCFTPGALLGLETSFWGRKMRQIAEFAPRNLFSQNLSVLGSNVM